MARKKKPEPCLGIRRRPNGKCNPAFFTEEEACAYLDKFTYPEEYEIVNLNLHPELIEK
jgi:hypothetical protein